MMSDEPVIRSRSRIPVNTPQPSTGEGSTIGQQTNRTPTQSNTGSDWMKSGAVARETNAVEMARNQEKERQRASGIYMPYRYWIPAGKQIELVVLDSEPPLCFYEHNLKDPNSGRYDVYESCPKEYEHCPLCDGSAGAKDSYYAMMLTVMVLDPYINKNGVTVPHSRKLMAVKTNEQPFFHRQLEQSGTLRGRQYLMARNSKQDPQIGRPEFIAAHSEEAILQTFGHAQVVAQDGKVLKQANADCYAYPYAQIFSRPSGDDLRRRYGGMSPIGSGAANHTMLQDNIGAAPITTGITSTIGRTVTPAANQSDIGEDLVPF